MVGKRTDVRTNDELRTEIRRFEKLYMEGSGAADGSTRKEVVAFLT